MGILNRLSRHRAEVEAIRYLDKMGLIDYTRKKVSELSKGMQQKIQFIIAMLHNPEILILDEPFVGLDPVNQMVLRDIISQNQQEKKIILISTHQMSEIEKIADHIYLINQGKMILDGTIKEIKSRFKEDAYYIETEDSIAGIKDLKDIKILEEHNQSCKISINNADQNKQKIIRALFEKLTISKFIQVEPSLNDIFIKLIQNDSKKK